MQSMRKIYALLMVAIYIAASAMSSISLLLCEHHHCNHTHSHHEPTCVCQGISLEEDCCNHIHPVLGDNHTEYIASSQRNESRIIDQSDILSSYALLSASVEVVTIHTEPTAIIDYGDEATPLRVAHLSTQGLRAPPALV